MNAFCVILAKPMDAASDAEEPSFVLIGNFSPPDARRLFAALAQAGIEFRAQFNDGVSRTTGSPAKGFGMYAQIYISVESEKLSEAEEIQRSLFGEFTP